MLRERSRLQQDSLAAVLFVHRQGLNIPRRWRESSSQKGVSAGRGVMSRLAANSPPELDRIRRDCKVLAEGGGGLVFSFQS